MQIHDLIGNEDDRRRHFPVAAERIFLGHAGVCPLPLAAVEATEEFLRRCSSDAQENGWIWSQVDEARAAAGRMLSCSAKEIALLGPTTLGLNLVALGFPWDPGDEVLFYPEDYPANVYPWASLPERGVRPVALQPERPGAITWDVVESALSDRTRLVSLASANFLSGYRIDVDKIGSELRRRGIYFCLDAIQTMGAFPLSVEHVDFLSADSHKWLLGPSGAGVFYVREELQTKLRPALLGSWNVVSPEFVAQESIDFYDGARRYECGMLNLAGIPGMLASMKLLEELGAEAVSGRILDLRRETLSLLQPLGYCLYVDIAEEQEQQAACGIITITHPSKDLEQMAQKLKEANISVSLRYNRAGSPFIRLSPHFYNTEQELARVAEVMK